MKQVVCGAAAAVIALVPAIAGAACFSEQEWQAAHVRVLESDLQVAALECANVEGHNYNAQYQTFLQRYDDRLKSAAKLLISHFQRSYGKDSQRQLDIFITRLANDASSRSMSDMLFCANSAATFQAALTIDKAALEQTAVSRVTDHGEVGDQCPVTVKAAPVIKVASAAAPAAPAVKHTKVIPAKAPTPAASATPTPIPAAQPTVGQAPAVQSAEKPATDKPKQPSASTPG